MQSDYFTEEQLELIQTCIEKHKDNSEAVKAQLRISQIQLDLANILIYKTHNYTDEGMGRQSLQKHLVARRNRFLTRGWNDEDKKIIKARELYDQGLVEMTTGIDGIYILLYAIPRKQPDGYRIPYFSEQTEEDFEDDTDI